MIEYNGNLIEFNLIKDRVSRISEDSGQDPSHAFLSLCLMECLDIDQYTAEDAIIDGSDDCGIDAIFIKSTSDEPEVYVFQSKYYLSADKYSRAFEGGAIDKMVQSVDELFLRPDKDRKYINEGLRTKLQEYKQLTEGARPVYRLVFCSNSYPPSTKAKQKLEHWVENHSYGQDIFRSEYLHLKELAKLMAPEQRRILDDKLRLSGTWFSHESGNAKTVVGRVSVEELALLYEEHGEYLFDKNVRIYLKDKNPVNQKIKSTLIGNASHEFFYLNNGITVVCNKLSYTPKHESPTIKMQGFQIVNGSQTTHTIHHAYQEGAIENIEQVFVLVKIVETEDPELLNSITEATNSQTAVTDRDLRSNDYMQKIIEENMIDLGYYYEARANKYLNDKDVRADHRVDAATAAQVWLAFKLQLPNFAITRKAHLFRDPLYSEIFKEDLDIKAYLDTYLLFKRVHKMGNMNKEKYPFANYAKFYVMAMMNRLEILNVKDFDSNQRKYTDVMDTIQLLLLKAQGGKAFTGYSAFFNQTSRLDKLYEQYNQTYLKEDR